MVRLQDVCENDKSIDSNNNTKIKVKDPTLYPSKSLIVDSLRTVVEYDEEHPLKNKKNSRYEIWDENGQSISPEELADRYFNNPEEYFKEDFQ